MAFRAVHAEWGTVFAHLSDLGCGRSWEAVWKTRPPAPLACDECGHAMHGKLLAGYLSPGSPLVNGTPIPAGRISPITTNAPAGHVIR